MCIGQWQIQGTVDKAVVDLGACASRGVAAPLGLCLEQCWIHKGGGGLVDDIKLIVNDNPI